jgi:hypothetical protein
MHCGHQGEEKLMTNGIPFNVSDLIVRPSMVCCEKLLRVSSALITGAKAITPNIVMIHIVFAIFIAMLTSL